MTLEEVTPEKFSQVFPRPFHAFTSAAFNQLNEGKADRVYYFLFKDSRYRLGLVGGNMNNVFCSPFSAPFGGFTQSYSDTRIPAIELAVSLLEEKVRSSGMDAIQITPPPPVYDESFLSKVANVLFRREYSVKSQELNFHFDLSKFSENYPLDIWKNARKNLTIGLNASLSFSQCVTDKEKQVAYGLIQQNRKLKGKPLRMTLDQVMATTSVIPADFFVVKDEKQTPIAAAIVFTVSQGVVQVIYWGDLPEHSNLKTMNYLSYKVFEYYKHKGFRAVDIGYSTENSIPNYGLCEFKESIGCTIQPKLTYFKGVAP